MGKAAAGKLVSVTGDVEIDAKRFQSQPQPSGESCGWLFLCFGWWRRPKNLKKKGFAQNRKTFSETHQNREW
jgi:hypothetical protein